MMQVDLELGFDLNDFVFKAICLFPSLLQVWTLAKIVVHSLTFQGQLYSLILGELVCSL
jgi:hypothetical protein